MEKVIFLQKTLIRLFVFVTVVSNTYSQGITDTTDLRLSLENNTAAIRDAFEKGDAALVAQLHSPDVIKTLAETM